MKSENKGDVLVLELEGQLDFETTQNFREQCLALLKGNEKAQVVFNLEKLRFVGSSGIGIFIKTLKDFNRKRGFLKMCHLSSEFTKMFRAYQTTRNPFEIYENESEAIASFQFPPLKRNRRKKDAPKES